MHVDPETGAIHEKRSADVEPVMQAVKAYKDLYADDERRNKNGGRLIGSVDPIVAQVWAKESGLKIGTAEYALYAKRKLQDLNFSKFSVARQ